MSDIHVIRVAGAAPSSVRSISESFGRLSDEGDNIIVINETIEPVSEEDFKDFIREIGREAGMEEFE